MSSGAEPDLVGRLLAPAAITVVGASPNGHITHHLLRNLDNRSCRFPGPIHLVNPGYSRLFDRACLPSPADVPGDPGLVYLLVRPEACLDALRALPARPDGVVLFPDASRESGGYEEAVAAWGREQGVAVLGPQSNGLVSTAGKVHGLLIPVVEELKPGPVALLAQSGGVLGGLVKYLAQRGVGLDSALEYGTECMLTMEDLAGRLLQRPEVRAIGVYADGIGSLERLVELLAAARRADKPIVLMVGGRSEAGGRAAASHSGAAASPARVLEGVCVQHGAVLARSLDELAWSLEVLHAAGYRRPGGPEVAVFSDSGGAGITLADALELAGVPLPEPEGEARAHLGDALNPFDFGSASMGQSAAQADAVRAVARDPRYGYFAFSSPIGLPYREQSVHAGQLDDFVAAVDAAGRVPFVASLFPFDRVDAEPATPALHGLGSTESAVKLRALRTWAAAAEPADRAPAEPELAAPAGTHGRTVTGEGAVAILQGLPLAWPRQAWVAGTADLERLGELSYPLVAKSEAGLAHRARDGGVLTGIATAQDLRNAALYLLDRFGGPVSVAEQVAHDEEYFVGAARESGLLVVLLGPGGAAAESAAAHALPMSESQLARFAAAAVGPRASAFAELVRALQGWLLRAPWVEALDLNPIVVSGGALVALDAKVHVGSPRLEPAAR